MEKRNPNTQTAATKRYHEKIGYISKSYKLNREIAEAFKDLRRGRGKSGKQARGTNDDLYPIGQRK